MKLHPPPFFFSQQTAEVSIKVAITINTKECRFLSFKVEAYNIRMFLYIHNEVVPDFAAPTMKKVRCRANVLYLETFTHF